MPSRADRDRLERALRWGAALLLAAAAWSALAPARAARRREVAAADTIALASWTGRPAAETLAVSVAEAPGPVVRAWLAALRAAGVAVSWHGEPEPVALAVEMRADPAGGARVLVAGRPDRMLVIADSLGPVDSARTRAGGVAFALPSWTGAVSAGTTRARARVSRGDTLAWRRIVVLGRAGWEARFVITALEERGWEADAQLAVAPGIAVRQGRPFPLDTARHAAVVVLDSLAGGDASAVVRFLAAGGGVVLGPGTATGLLAAVAPALESPRVAPLPRPVALDGRPALARRPLRPRADAVALERRDGAIVAAARRAGPGRIVQVAYEDTWRWRLGGGDGAPDAHRDWWTDLVAAAARLPAAAPRPADVDDPAPVAALVRAIGPAAATDPPAVVHQDPRRWLGWLAALGLASLLGEWASRRLRGAA